jgi:cell division protein FtsA
MFALGGRAFTKSLADRLDLPFARAEEIKIDFAKGAPVEQQAEIELIISEDVAVWAAGVELVLEEFAKEGQLPGRIYLCGGGSRLPHLQAALRDKEFARRLPFVRPPQVQQMVPQSVMGVADSTGLLVDEQDVTPLGLARQAIEMSGPQPPLDAALQRALRAMKV